MRNKNIFIFFIVISLYLTNCVFAKDNIITVYFNETIGEVNKGVFGNNFIGYERSTAEWERGTPIYYGDADYGAGVWNPEGNKSVIEAIELAKNAGVSVIRFPGGCGAHHYDWKETIGKKRKHFLYGVDEFMKTVEEIGAVPIFTVSYFTGDAKDAADLVEYLNVISDGRHQWADRRAKNGHPEPYRVKYFEFGNEVWHGDHRNIKEVSPEEYAEKYLKYQEAMKKIDPSIQLGLILHPYDKHWDTTVLEKVGSKFDFVVEHSYSPLGGYRFYKDIKTEDLFLVALGSPVIYFEVLYAEKRKLIKEKTGRDDVYFAVTEYGAFGQSSYRHSLGAALVNAEHLRIFMKPEHRISMANHWHFSNSYMGMIKSEDDFITHDYQTPMYYIKRPNYYVYEFYNKHFGNMLLNVELKGDTYSMDKYSSFITNLTKEVGVRNEKSLSQNLLGKAWEIEEFSGVLVEEKDGVLKIDFQDPKKFNYAHASKHIKVQPETYYILSGYIRTEDIIGGGVFLEVIDSRGWAETQSAETTKGIGETTDWQYVHTIYKTLPDVKSVDVRVRRIGHRLPFIGKVFVKNVELKKYVPQELHTPYLSVNASRSKNGNKVYLMVVSKNMQNTITAQIELKDFLPLRIANAWVLDGPSVDATNENERDNVKVIHKKFEIKGNPFEFTFSPHSLTAIEIEGHANQL